MKPAEVKGRDTAVFILKSLAEHRAELLTMLAGADAEALLEALRKDDTTPVNGLVHNLTL